MSIMTEYDKFKQFFNKYGVEYEAGEWFKSDDKQLSKEKQFIEVLGMTFEFRDGVFSHLYEPEFDTKIERLPDGK